MPDESLFNIWSASRCTISLSPDVIPWLLAIFYKFLKQRYLFFINLWFMEYDWYKDGSSGNSFSLRFWCKVHKFVCLGDDRMIYSKISFHSSANNHAESFAFINPGERFVQIYQVTAITTFQLFLLTLPPRQLIHSYLKRVTWGGNVLQKL